MPRSARHFADRTSRSIAAIAALAIALTGFIVTPSAASEPDGAPEREVSDGAWDSPTPTPMRSSDFPADNARLDRDAPQLSPAASPTVSGTLEFRLPDNSTDPVSNGLVRFWRETSPDFFELENDITSFGTNGEFSASVPAGTYRIEFITFDVSFGARTYWNGEAVFLAADELVVNEGMDQNLGTVIIEQRLIFFDRIAGLNRFETAAALTAQVFDGTTRAPVVYIVNAFGFADALSAGPAAAAQGGVLLPVSTASIPSIIHDELTRLNPERIVIAGGVSVVSESVETALQAYVDSPDDVDRIAGPDRYATSRAIVLDAFGAGGVADLFIATGRNFPDALAAGPAASQLGGAVLLVDGSAASLPPATRTLLNGFGEPNVFLAGGPSVISPVIEAAIGAEVGGAELVTRLAGSDRYSTAQAINAFAFGASEAYPDFAFIATGTGFADALAAGPVAAAFQAPLFLSAPACLRQETFIDIVDLLVAQVLVVGGPGALSNRVVGGDFC